MIIDKDIDLIDTEEEIAKYWNYGFIDIKDKTNKGVVNERTINYITKYITKTDEIHKEYKSIILATAGLVIYFVI